MELILSYREADTGLLDPANYKERTFRKQIPIEWNKGGKWKPIA